MAERYTLILVYDNPEVARCVTNNKIVDSFAGMEVCWIME